MSKKWHEQQELDKRLSRDAEILDRYLLQYKDCINRRKSLERRKTEIQRDFSPIKPINYDGMPHGAPSGDGMACSLVVRLDEIDTRINDQIKKAAILLADIMNVIDFLPEKNHDEVFLKTIFENRYIDRMGWERICNENSCSRSTAMRYWKRGLNHLLTYKKVGKILKEFFEAEKC